MGSLRHHDQETERRVTDAGPRPNAVMGQTRVAAVTGAGRGIGRAHALRLAREGFAVVVNDLGCALDGTGGDLSPAADVAAEIEALGGTALSDSSDVGSIEGGGRVVGAALEAFGRIDVLVNNAGFSFPTNHETIESESYLDRHLAVVLKGTLGSMRAAIPRMKEQGWGRIVNTVSEVAFDMHLGGPGAYGIAKAAVWSTTLSTAAQLLGTGITVNALAPNARTRMTDIMVGTEDAPKDLSPLYIAEAAAYLVSDEAHDITGRVIFVAGDAAAEYVLRPLHDSDLVSRIEDFSWRSDA